MGRKLAGIILACFVSFASFSQIGIQGGGSGNAIADALVNNLVGQGVSYANAHFTGTTGLTAGTYSNNGYFTNGNSAVGISSGIILSSGNVFNAEGPNNFDDISYNWIGTGDADMQAVVGAATYDACGLEFDFIPQSDVISFRYVFASEEYNEFVATAFNDAFAFFISGPGIVGAPNIALIPGTSTPVAINNVNNGAVASPGGWATGPCTNCGYYVDTYTDANQEYDGHTTVLTATANVIPCQTYHMKLIVTDVADGNFDSSVFLESGSFTSPSISGIDVTYSQPNAGGNANAVEGCSNAIITLNMSSPSTQPRKVPFYLSGLAGFNVDYTTIPDITSTFNTTFPGQYYVTIPAGSLSTALQIVPINDVDIEATENVHISVQMNLCSGTSYQDGDVFIIDNSVPMVVATSPDTAICLGASTNVTANVTNGQQPFTYTWDPVAANNSTINVTPGTDQVYNVTVTDACGAVATENEMVVVYPLPTAEITGSATQCSNATDSVLLSVNLTGAAPWDIVLSDGLNSIPLSGVPSSFTLNVLPDQTTTYSILSVSDLHCSGNVIMNTLATVTINPVPTASISGATSLCNTGTQSTNLSVALTGNAPWSLILSDGTTSDTLSGILASPYITTVAPLTTTTYTILSVSDMNCTISVGDSVIVSVTELPVVSLGNDTALCTGASLTLYAGNPGSTYLWNDFSTEDSLLVTQTGVYSVTVTDVNLCEGSDMISIIVSPMLPAQIVGDTLVCTGFTTDYQVPQVAGHTYVWTVTGGTATSLSSNPINVTWGNGPAGSLILTETDVASGCSATTNQLNVGILQLPTPNINGDQYVCTGATGQYSTTDQSSHLYTWSVLGGTINSGANTNQISVTWGSLTSGTVYLTENIPNTFGCAVTANAYVITIFNQPPNLQINDPAAVCAPGTVNILNPAVTAGSTGVGGMSFWADSLRTIPIVSPGTLTTTGTYFISAFNSCGQVTLPVHVFVNTATANLVITNPDAVCFPDGADLTDALITSGSQQVNGVTYWNNVLATNPLLFPDSVTTQGTYYLVGLNACGTDTAPVYVSIHPAMPVLLIHNPDTTCAPFTIDLTDSLVTAGSQNVYGLTYWYDSTAISSIIDPDLISTEGTYYIMADNACGAVVKSVVAFINAQLVQLTFQINKATCSDGKDGKIHTAVSGGQLPYVYLWSTVPSQATADINSVPSGAYSVTVTDAMGCSVTGTAQVGEADIACLEIPSAFTPNADGSNDKWEFKNMGLYPNISVEIFNRWGALVYKSENYVLEPWDGTYKGNDAPAGTYVFIVNQNNGYEPINGTLTIIR